MANTNVTRLCEYFQKKGICVAVATVNADSLAEFAAAGSYKLFKLPPDAIIQDAFIFAKVASQPVSVELGTTEGGAEIMTLGNTSTLGKTGTFAGETDTGSGVDVYADLDLGVTSGDFIVVVQYLEYTKNTGEYTRFE